jgi:hypothetical protein
LFIAHVLKHSALKKEPDSMTEEKAGGCRKHDEFGDRLRVLMVAFEKERSELGNKKFEVITKDTREVRVHSTLFQLFDCSDLMGIQTHHMLNH